MIDEIRHDLALIVDQAKWAHVHGYVKTGRGLAAEQGVVHRLEDQGDDEVGAPTWDLELGSHPAREAYQHASRTIGRADVTLAGVLGRDGRTWQPMVVFLSDYAPPVALERAARSIRWRLERVDPEAKQLKTIRKAFDRCVRGLSKALDVGPADGIAHNERPCKTCRIRPQAERERDDGSFRPAAAGECNTCATWRRRNGTARPVELDTGPVNEARAAQARRMARGEGWGAA